MLLMAGIERFALPQIKNQAARSMASEGMMEWIQSTHVRSCRVIRVSAQELRGVIRIEKRWGRPVFAMILQFRKFGH